MDCSLADSSIHGIFQARILEWVAISFSRGSFHVRWLSHLKRPRRVTEPEPASLLERVGWCKDTALTFASGLFWAGGKWESTDAEGCLLGDALIWGKIETSEKDEECHKTPLLGNFMTRKRGKQHLDGPAQTSLTSSVFSHISTTVCCSWKPTPLVTLL